MLKSKQRSYLIVRPSHSLANSARIFRQWNQSRKRLSSIPRVTTAPSMCEQGAKENYEYGFFAAAVSAAAIPAPVLSLPSRRPRQPLSRQLLINCLSERHIEERETGEHRARRVNNLPPSFTPRTDDRVQGQKIQFRSSSLSRNRRRRIHRTFCVTTAAPANPLSLPFRSLACYVSPFLSPCSDSPTSASCRVFLDDS